MLKKRLVQAFLVIAAVVLIMLGASNGGYMDTWSKAARICFECIGIG